MGTTGNVWTIVLAAGDGTRLSHLTTDRSGRAIPKQYCALKGGGSLLRRAVLRAQAISGLERTAVVVAAEHRCWWAAELADLSEANVIVQPCNRGTACGVLLPLMHVLLRDPGATVVVLPSDHVVADEVTLLDAVATAIDHVDDEPERLVLLGLSAEGPDTALGWICPDGDGGSRVRSVSQFVEKPDREAAEELVRAGALWNSFIFAMRAADLYGLFEWTLPWLTRVFAHAFSLQGPGSRGERVQRFYDRLPSVDFSRAVLQNAGHDLRVVEVPPCGWFDVGTPEAVVRCAERCARQAQSAEVECAWAPRPPLDLSDVVLGHHSDPPKPARTGA